MLYNNFISMWQCHVLYNIRGFVINVAYHTPHIIWKNDNLGKSGYPGISQYRFCRLG